MIRVTDVTSDEYITPIYMNGLQGRVLNVKSNKKNTNNILIVYDLLSSIENSWELVRALSRFGAVTITDLPGFGGMESFNKIGEKPSVKTLADYLAAFIKLRYRRTSFVIVGVGYGFSVATLMLQAHPELARKCQLAININGPVHYNDVKNNQLTSYLELVAWRIMNFRLINSLVRLAMNRPTILRSFYKAKYKEKKLSLQLNDSQQDELLANAVNKWLISDSRTFLSVRTKLARLNLCEKRLKVPAWLILFDSDKQDLNTLEQHNKVIFEDVRLTNISKPFELLSVMEAGQIYRLLPVKLRRRLNKKA